MEHHHNLTTNAVGFCLLPSELIRHILSYLPLPEIVRLKSVNKSIASIISNQDFVRDYNLRSRSTTWLFIYKKRWHRDTVLYGFTDQSNRWFKIVLTSLLKPIIFPGESLYFLAANGNFLLFAFNTRQQVIAVNLLAKRVREIPPSPLGPRGTCSWRRSGMKLVSGSDHFRFLFVELVDSRPVLFVYTSETDKWQSLIATEDFDVFPRGSRKEGDDDMLFLNATNGPRESLVIAVRSECDAPVVVRPRFLRGLDEARQVTAGFNSGNRVDRVYGDGHMLTLKSNGVGDAGTGVRILDGMELWSLGHRQWEYNSKVPTAIMDKIKKPYGVMIGCLEESNGIIRTALLSSLEGLWDIIWLHYDPRRSRWHWIPLPDCSRTKGLNLAGIAFSSGLTLTTSNCNPKARESA